MTFVIYFALKFLKLNKIGLFYSQYFIVNDKTDRSYPFPLQASGFLKRNGNVV